MIPHERSKALHNNNMSLPNAWGIRRQFRCVKPPHPINQTHHVGSSQPRNRDLDSSKNPQRFKLPEEDRPVVDDPSRPWNLRTRRAACKAPLLKIDDKKSGVFIQSPTRRSNLEIDTPRRNNVNANGNDQRQQQSNLEIPRVKFSVSLTKEEIEEDFLKMINARPPRRPKKRPRIVQKYLDTVFPGLWLSEITPDIYKVPELPES